MKKLISAVLSGVMLASVFLCGCNTMPGEPEATETETTAEATAVETEPEPPHIDVDRYNRIKGFYSFKLPEGGNSIQLYDDSIGGGCTYSIYEDQIYFSYTSYRNESSLTLRIDPLSDVANVEFELIYGDTRYYGMNSGDSIPLDGFETFIDAVIEKDESAVRIYDDTAWEANKDNIRKDLPIVYARLIKFSNAAFEQLGFGFEELGIPFGDKYRSVDPSQFTSQEIDIKNECRFVNGVCEDCGKHWADYYYEAVGKLGYIDTNSKWCSVYGQRSASMFDPSDYVQYSSYGPGSCDIYYQHTIMKDPNSTMAGQHTENCTLHISQNKKKISSYFVFNYEQGMHSVGDGIVGSKFIYQLTVEAKDGDYSKIFESKETLKKNAELCLFVMGDEGSGYDVWFNKKDEDIKKLFDEIPFTTFYTKDEFIDMVWNDYQRMFESMDKGMIWMKTSLADAGIKWKNED